MQRSCPSCATEVEGDEARWCPNPDCGAYISWEDPEDDHAEAGSTRRPGEEDEPPAPPLPEQTTVIPAVEAQVGCPSCGMDNPESRVLCQRCGAPLQQAPAPPAPPPPPARRVGTARLVGAGVIVAALLAVLVVVLDGDDDVELAQPTSSPSSTEEPATPPPSPADTPTAVDDGLATVATPAWVAILRSMETSSFDRSDAVAHAAGLTELSEPPGVLLSDDFASLNAGYWVVFVDGFADRDAASAYCEQIDDTVPGCYARLVDD